jgi:hypothetical protein
MAYYVAIKQELGQQGWVNEVHARTDFQAHPMREYRLVPADRLVARLGLGHWEHQSCPFDETDYRPQRVTIPLGQHIGLPSEPVVSAGTQVAVGDLIAKIPDGKLGTSLHASIAGQVDQVTDSAIEIVA